MKTILLLAFVLALSQAIDFEYKVDTQYGIYELNDDEGSIADVIACLNDTELEIKNLIELANAIGEQRYFDVARDVIKILNDGIDLLEHCKALFCYGPTFKKCEAENDSTCEMWGALVYPDCKPGFTNWDCCVCSTECPAGWRDDGLYCAKPEAYGRGAGYPLWEESKCNAEHEEGCEKYGALWYPKCKEGFHNVGCCICSPDCPEGWSDIGVSCKKPETYGRGVGYPVSFGLQCLLEKQQFIQERIEQTSQEELPDVCAGNRGNLLNLSQDSDAKFSLQSSEPGENLQPDQILSLIEGVTEYVEMGCLDIDQNQQEQLY